MIHKGISNCHYALPGKSPIAMPGAVSLARSSDVSYTTKKIWKDGLAIEMPVGIIQAATKLSLEITSLPESFLTDILGYQIDGRGVLIEYPLKQIQSFTLLYQSSTDKSPCRYQYSTCYCLKPSWDCTTITDKTNVDTRKLDIIVTGIPISKSISKSANATIYNNWFNTVY